MKSHAKPASALPAVLARHPVFSRLDEAARDRLATRFTRQTFGNGALVAEGSTLSEHLALVLDGGVLMRQGAEDDATVTLRAGEMFGAGAGPHDAEVTWSAHADGAATLAFLAADELSQLCAEQPVMTLFLVPPAPPAIAPARSTDPYLSLMTTPVRGLIRRTPITLPPEASILEAAQTMRDQRVSSVLLIEQGHLFGLVTDRDLRNRALAAGLAPETRVLEIATLAPLSIAIDRPAFEALLLMARHNIHHVPVLDGQRVVGMITATNLTEQLSTSAVYVAGDIYKQQALPGLVAAAARVKQIQRNLAAAEASAYSTGHIVTAITDALTARLLQLGEAQLGPAPVDYAWVAAGSQARSEQTAKSDQDNCMILDDRYDEAAHGAYFKALATFVNDGLDACGYVYCPGEMMARTDEWRQPQHRWAEYFRRWTDTPEPKALMLTCVFFDLRLIYGRASLLDDLRRDVLRKTRDNRIFLAYMVGNALTHRPPLSMFGSIATVRNGELRDAVDLKHSGIVPVVDLARIYALAGGHEEVNTSERLAIAAQSHEISEQGARDLGDALEFLATQRIRHQARQMDRGVPADNFLSLGELSNFERRQLKGAFEVVQTLQNVLAQRYR